MRKRNYQRVFACMFLALLMVIESAFPLSVLAQDEVVINTEMQTEEEADAKEDLREESEITEANADETLQVDVAENGTVTEKENISVVTENNDKPQPVEETTGAAESSVGHWKIFLIMKTSRSARKNCRPMRMSTTTDTSLR